MYLISSLYKTMIFTRYLMLSFDYNLGGKYINHFVSKDGTFDHKYINRSLLWSILSEIF